MARRKNATFTIDQTYGSGHGDRKLVRIFYNELDKLYPDDTPIPIPPEWNVRPARDLVTQARIFADYAVTPFAPE